MKKLVFMVALCAALVSCGNKKADNTSNGNDSIDSIDSTAQMDSMANYEIIDITGEWVAEAPQENAPALSLNSDKTAKVTAVPATSTNAKAVAAKTAKPSSTPVQANWKQLPSSPNNSNPVLVLMENVPGKNNTDSVVYEIVSATDSTLTIQGEAGVFRFKKHNH